MHKFLASLPRKYKIGIMLISDVVLLPLALWTAIALRYGSFNPDIDSYLWLFLVVPIFTVPIFIRLGLYRAVIRYVDVQVITTVFYGVTLSVLVMIAIVAMTQVKGLPRTSLVIYWVIAIIYIAVSRYFAKVILRSLERKDFRKQKVAIYGAGQAGLQTALALMSGAEFKPVLFFDDSPELRGTTIAGIRVYDPSNAEELLTRFGCNQLLLALPSATRSKRKEIIQRFEGKNIQLKTIPGMGELVTGQVKIEDIREVGIEDLLGRDSVPPDENLIKSCVTQKNVMVTGAGGSIGTELCRQILKQNPKTLVLVEMSEFGLYKIHQELTRLFPYITIKAVLANVVNKTQVTIIIKEYKINTIYHTAAYKHVPLVEENIAHGILNNVFGTLSVVESCIENNVDDFVLISTDKAVRPTNVMGATKRVAELIVQMYAKIEDVKTKLSMVRFGNVLGSSGSVVPLFKEQIKYGGPVTVTHPEVTRYFMTIPEAAQLVMQAGAMAQNGDVFVLDMGEPIKIVDLATKMINLSGFEVLDSKTGLGDIAIEFVGLRPGEKLYEELLIGTNTFATSHPRIMKAQENFLLRAELYPQLLKLNKFCDENKLSEILDLMKILVPEYLASSHHNDVIKS